MQESGVEFAVESRDGSSVEGSGEDYEVAFGFDSGKNSSVEDSRVDYGVDSGEDSSVQASGGFWTTNRKSHQPSGRQVVSALRVNTHLSNSYIQSFLLYWRGGLPLLLPPPLDSKPWCRMGS